MGSWNATCHLSNLPICCGEKVVVIPVVKSHTYESEKGYYNYYPNSCYTPLTPPIHSAQYADYGTIDGSSLEDDNNHIMDYINKLTFVQCKKSKDSGDINEETITFDSIADFIAKVQESIVHNEYIYLVKLNRKYQVDFVMYLEDIYTGLLDAWKKANDFSILEKELIEHYNTLKNTESFLFFSSDNLGFYYVKNIIQSLELDARNTEIDIKLIQGIVEAEKFTSILGALRKGYMCITGRGSQSENYPFYFLFNRLIQKHIIDTVREQLYDYCEDDEFVEKYDTEQVELTDDIVIEYMEKHCTDIW